MSNDNVLKPSCERTGWCQDPRPDRCECAELRDPLKPARGVINGLVGAVIVWACVAGVVWAVWFR